MPVLLADDKVWFDESTKVQQICTDVATAHLAGRSVLVLSHFEATLSQLSRVLREKGIGHEQFSSFNPVELCANNAGLVWLGSARAFQVTNTMTPSAAGNGLEIICAEHHPMRSRDQQVIDSAAKLVCDGHLCFHFSLDDPVMKYFGVGPIKALFEQLGMSKGECISHHLVTTAIRSAQEKIESKVGREMPTHSVEDWFKYNLRK